jgi:hypothetical protein
LIREHRLNRVIPHPRRPVPRDRHASRNTSPLAPHCIWPEIGQDWPATMRPVARQSLTYSMRTTPPGRLRVTTALETLKIAAHGVDVVCAERRGRELLRTDCGLSWSGARNGLREIESGYSAWEVDLRRPSLSVAVHRCLGPAKTHPLR